MLSRRYVRRLTVALASLFAVIAAGCSRPPTADAPPAPEPFGPERLEDPPGLHNVFRLTNSLFTGSGPDGEAGFRSIAGLGVKTVVSVDGAPPDLPLAKKYGLRYVHLPIGYDGVPRVTSLRIARVVRDLPGPVYLHCHHGRHRGPAAAVAALRCLEGRCPAASAVDFLRAAGTDPKYVGLFASVEAATPPSPGEWEKLPKEFPEAAEVPDLVRQMVAIDERWDRLKAIKAAGWKQAVGSDHIDASQEATLLGEHYRESARLPATTGRTREFAILLAEAVGAAGELEAAVKPLAPDRADRAFVRSAALCVRCHTAFRDRP